MASRARGLHGPTPLAAVRRRAIDDCEIAAMKFIEMTGKSLAKIVKDDELHVKDLPGAGVRDDTVVRVNQQGDVEVRLRDGWDVIGGLLGNFEERVRQANGPRLGLTPIAFRGSACTAGAGRGLQNR